MTDRAPSPPTPLPQAGEGSERGGRRRLVTTLAVAVGAWKWRRATPAGPDPAAMRLFAANLPDADGVPRPLKAWQGKLLIVNFWATWCAPCTEEMPELQQFADQVGGGEVALIGIGVDDADKIRDFRSEHRLRFPLLVAGFDGMLLAQGLGNAQAVLPYTALISPDGQILEEHTGRIPPGELRRWVTEHRAR